MATMTIGALGASSFSMESNYLTLSVDAVHPLADLSSEALQLNERQCQDLSSKIFKVVENIQQLIPRSRASKLPFRAALKNLYRVLENAKFLVHQCCGTDWCRAVVFQIHNEEAFREVLLELGLRYNVLYELSKGDPECTIIQADDLRQSTLFLPASESEVREDNETLRKSLELVAGTSNDRNQYIARYLLRKLEFTSVGCLNEDLSMPDALLRVNETEPRGTWILRRFLGSGSGVSCVCEYEWFGIPCARKEFRCNVPDVIFRREAAILAQLDHPNIVKFFCCSTDTELGYWFIAMEIMEKSLYSLIQSRREARRPFPVLVVLDIMAQIARGVRYLHGLKIAHRDLKPLNVVVSETKAAHLEDCFCVKLVDFGMSETKVHVSKSNTISIPGDGTTHYRAPEVFPQAQRVGVGMKRKLNWFKADAYSFSIICAALLCLKEPFIGVPASKLYEDLLQGVRPVLPGDCPEDLAALLKDCWATVPQLRPGFAEICSRIEKCKFRELLRGSAGRLQGLVGSEYIQTVLMKQCRELSQCANSVPYVQSQCDSSVLCNSGDIDEAFDIVQSNEEVSGSINVHSRDRQRVASTWSELEQKKRFGLWSCAIPSLGGVVSMLTGATLLNYFRERRLKDIFEQKCEEFGVKPTIFSYNELKVATQDFHKYMMVGLSNYGAIAMYQAVLPNGNVVAVTKLNEHSYLKMHIHEVFHLSKIRHKNIATLLGCCLHHNQVLQVYKYVESSDIYQILLDIDRRPGKVMLTWLSRFKMCLGVARGLHFLHAVAHPRVIHGKIDAKNVLVDREFSPKIGQFGDARFFIFPDEESHMELQEVTGGWYSSAPESVYTGRLTPKVDVYSFGFLCLKIIIGLDHVVHEDYGNLANRAWRLYQQGRLLDVVDPTLELTDVEAHTAQRVLQMCLWCLQDEPKKRPSMAQVLFILEGERA